MSIKVITPPATDPITLAEAVAHLRVVGADDNTYITSLIVAARQAAENITGRALMPQTLERALDCFHEPGAMRNPYRLMIPRPPLTSITSIKYLNDAGVLTTMDAADYVLDDHSEPARLTPAYGTCWPSTYDQANAVLIRYVAGYANADAVPQEIKAWMLLRIGMLYENRESVAVGVTFAELPHVDRLLDAYRIRSI
jgi:uncharacterized phiE125 gp8 family phage protein